MWDFLKVIAMSRLFIPDKSPVGSTEVNGKELNYHLGKTYISLAQLKYDAANDKKNYKMRDALLEEADKYKKLSINNFWKAFVMGNSEAPFYLFQYVQDSNEDDIATLMFGVARYFTPKKCDTILITKRPKISAQIKLEIVTIIKLMFAAYSQVEEKGVSHELIVEQTKKFNNVIKLKSGKLMGDYFPGPLFMNENCERISDITANSYYNREKKLVFHSDNLSINSNDIAQNKQSFGNNNGLINNQIVVGYSNYTGRNDQILNERQRKEAEELKLLGSDDSYCSCWFCCCWCDCC